MEGVIAVVWVDLREALDSRGRCIAKGVETLIVVPSYEEANASFGHAVDEPKVHWIEVLKLIDDEVLDPQQLHRVERASLDAFHA